MTAPQPTLDRAIYLKSTASPLTASDRCDQCRAQAFAKVVMGAGDLFFCRHHLEQHKEALMTQAKLIHDYTDALRQGAN